MCGVDGIDSLSDDQEDEQASVMPNYWNLLMAGMPGTNPCLWTLTAS